jgi:phosphoglycerol transferase MdoB-like AlkP superfamily enzyme
MKQRLIFILKYTSIWFSFFLAIKLVFLLANIKLSLAWFKIWPVIVAKGILLDFSVLGYLLILPSLLMIFNALVPGKWYKLIIRAFTYIVLLCFSILVVADIVIYPEWGFRLDITPLYYLDNPNGALASLNVFEIIIFSILSLFLFLPFYLLFRKLFDKTYLFDYERIISASPVFLFVLVFLFLPIRGGLGTAPINTGSVYFHNNALVNHASLNLFWNILYSITNIDDYSNPFSINKSYDEDRIPRMNSNKDRESTPILTTSQPNILVIILESFTANIVGSLNNEYSTAKNLDSLSKEGVLFSNFYASGDRSDKGLVSILSGYPTLLTTSIIKYPNKTEKIPGLAKTLKKYGYKTAFYYGGDIDFANMRSYIVNTGFEHIISRKDFKSKENISSWGVPDEFLFRYVQQEIEKETSPYFKVMFTLSSHKPYDVPGDKLWVEGNDDQSQFLNSVGYTDYHLGKFIRSLKSNGHLKNTLVVMLADHGSAYPGPVAYNSKSKYHIPLILFGPVIQEKGVVVDTYGCQIDFPATLLGQLGMNASEYTFSKNMLTKDPTNDAFYAYNNGFGYLSPNIEIIYNLTSDKFSVQRGTLTDSLEKDAKAYYQNLYDNFLSLN